ncbi:tRNA (N6-isopentenyl adenosine(37)-C2)-methylthiotransferase MiaB [Pyruvatibacter sp.]|uniref:tRNA (N6-isopentenyl adenosine(37)-C2)-methylthiotransferase MiaB n=1 Tax=Pyruvatibacter sp. TaxID=1981328 RepID=UPI003267F46D
MPHDRTPDSAPENDKPQLFIKTYGCQMNVYDSDRMSDALAPKGYETAQAPDAADVVILNTCHIRENAAAKVYSELGRLRILKEARLKQGRPLTIGVAGCVAQAEGQEMLDRAPVVDFVVGSQAYHRLPQLVERAKDGERLVETDFPTEDKFEHLPQPSKKVTLGRGPAAFLTVQEGCDKFCTFCVVPYTRGSEVSRPMHQLLDEARGLVDAGVREITLLGQNVNAWHGNGLGDGAGDAPSNLGRLLFALAEIDGLERLRYTTSHPRDMHDDLFAAHRDLDKLMPYLHLPVQAGSDKILKAMNRQHTAQDYLQLIDKLREARPDISLSGDFIVGFPGETDDDFEATMQLVRDVGYAQAYSFKYSQRPGTPAAIQETQVPEDVKVERLARLQALLNEQSRDFNAASVGKTMSVLLDRVGKRDGQLAGRSPYLQAVHLDAPMHLRGEIVPVVIEAAHANSLSGKLVDISATDSLVKGDAA